jgi:protocatechuate 3,4-dioxygenase beta subunit
MTDFKNPSVRRSGMHTPVLLTALMAAALLTACGGGGGDPGAVGPTASTGTTTPTTPTTPTVPTTPVVPAAPTVAVSTVNASGASSTSLTSATPLTVKSLVLDGNKKPVANAIVTFATDNSLAVFSPTAGTALTDANGVATISMRVATLGSAGAATVTATSNVAGATVSGTTNYAVSATALTFGALSAAPASLQAYGSTTLSVDLLTASGKYTDQSVDVSFSSACVTAGKATLATKVGTVNGTAQTVYRDKGCGQNDLVTVTANGVSKPASTTLTIAPPAAASVQFMSAVPSDQSIVIKGQGGNGRTETATLTFKVIDNFGNPLAGKQVSFTSSTNAITVNKTTDTTDATGSVVTTVNSGATPTSFRIQATLPNTGVNGGPDISTYSDSIVVTSGLPVQTGFSISTTSFNVEGWTTDSTVDKPAATIQVLLADAFGNPVPDGTPIVFQTNLGAVGSASKGGCNTVNGGCVVDFRAQNPRIATGSNSPSTPCNGYGTGTSSTNPRVSPDSSRTGVATICASTTDGTNTLFGKTTVFLSSSHATGSTLNGAVLSTTSANSLGTASASAPKTVQIQISDENGNPMPQGSTVAVGTTSNVSVTTPLPATVPNLAGDNAVSSNQGSFHSISVSSANAASCSATPAVAPQDGTFTITVTTPNGTVTNIPFKLSFSCP